MKAAMLVALQSPLVVAPVDIPELDVGQVLVKIHFSGICGKQLDEVSGRRPDPYLPHLLGHEGAGVVVDAGPGVRKVKYGDHVVLHWMKGAGIEAETPQFSCKGSPINAGRVTTFSEYTIASENRVTPIPTDIRLDVAALLGCAVTTGLGIVSNDAGLIPGQSIAVFGVGGLGINVLQGAALINAYPIVAIDLRDDKLEWAGRFGATHTINASRDDPQEVLMALSQGRGFDVTVDTTGITNVRELAYHSASHTGKAILAGVPHHEERITIDTSALNYGRRLTGSHGGDTDPDLDIPRCIQLYRLGKLKLEEQITHRYKLDRINDALEVVRKGEAGKCVIEMW